jgi:peptidoglycan/LPS O-acetylase OafA/YrhL
MPTGQRNRPHLGELDRLRVITALSVVAVHVAANSAFLDRTTLALQIQNGFVTLFHFTREVFMFVTAFALVYVYYGKPFSAARFWKRRSVGVLVPYVCWTLIYAWVNPHPASPLPFAGTVLFDIVTGNASYQLYYILLTLEFYLLLPWFLAFLRRVAHHPWTVLGISFALELALLWASQQLDMLRLPTPVSGFVRAFLDRFVLVYQFYFLLGAFAALYLDAVRAFLLRHGRWVIAAGAAGLAALEINYVFSISVEHEPIDSAIAVLQPIMAFYSLAVIALLYWLTYRRSLATKAAGSTRVEHIWRWLSDASFGLYLVHPLILAGLLDAVHLLAAWPVALLVVALWLLTVAPSLGLTFLLLQVPVLSRLVGRPAARPLPSPAARAGAIGGTALRRLLPQPARRLSAAVPAFKVRPGAWSGGRWLIDARGAGGAGRVQGRLFDERHRMEPINLDD